jgi:hypothetical protein
MNIKTITVGFVAVTIAVGGIFIKLNSNENQSVYTPRNLNNDVRGHAGHAEYWHMLREDPATGKIDLDLVNQAKNEIAALSKQNNKAALGLNWTQMGPDNVGGRTRAILVDKDNINTVYAGSVAGGLFVSYDGTITWNQVGGHTGILGENLAVSCITQTANGRIFFGTGATFGEPHIGNGVYEYVPSTGTILPVLTSGNVPNNSTGDLLSHINMIASYGNRLYIATKSGMAWADPNGSGIYPSTFSGWTNPLEVIPGLPETGTCQDIDIASDGSMLVCFSGRIYTSPNGNLGSFTKTTISGGRISGAIAPSDPNIFYLLRSSSILVSLDYSNDKGNSWTQIVPGGSGCIDPFRQNDCSTQYAQGGYDDAIAVNPSDPGHVIVGGVQLFELKAGSWLKSANLFESPMNPYYVHADKHTIVWANSSTVYVGSDGGVAKSEDAGTTWQARNYGYNVTTFYDMNVAANGFLLGGAQDNGTQLFANGMFGSGTPLGSFEIMGGDGFDVAFSNFSGGIAYSTSQFGKLLRSAGGSGGEFYNAELTNLVYPASGNPTEPFHTVIENWEDANDSLSVDSIQFIFNDTVPTMLTPGDSVLAGGTILAGTTIIYPSLTNGIDLYYTVPSNIVLNSPSDTLKLVDPIQNKFALRTSQGVFITRDAARLNAMNIEWFKVSTASNIEHMEFSPDGNHLFLASSAGSITRISNLSMANDYDGLDIRSGVSVITSTPIATGLGGTASVAVDRNNGNNLIATTSGYTTNNHVYRCTNALTATSSAGTFTAIQGTGLPYMPVYDAEIDFNDSDKVIIGTEWGVWTSDNAFSAAAGSVTWSDESGNGMTHVPVYAVEQQQLYSSQCINSGFVYLGTFGRGFYMSTDLFTAIDENDFSESDGNSFVSNLNVYPNPVNNVGTVAFDLKQNSKAKIKIYNLSGSLVKTIEIGSKTKGSHKEQFNASSLSVGSYILSLETGSERSVAKFIVTR